MSPFSRVVLIVLDSVGIGELPDADKYGDEGSDTLGNICQAVDLELPNLARLGLGNIRPLRGIPPARLPEGCFGRMAESSPGKDSVTGHWEIAGVVLERPFPTFPHGFPRQVIDEFERTIGRGTLGNDVASGTEIIARLGDAHVATGKPIVYTSADSVFQIAAHEDVVPVRELYRMCEAAYRIVVERMGVGRVIARPFVGPSGAYVRTANRHDYAMPSPRPTLLDVLAGASVGVFSVGKVSDLFAGRGVTRSWPTTSDTAGVDAIVEVMQTELKGLVFANLVDFDTQYGHRNDIGGYAAHLRRFDARLPELLAALAPDDLLIVTADHGNDPSTPSTDHSREYVPLLATGRKAGRGVDLGTRATFADLGQTVAAVFGVGPLDHGSSFLEALCS